MNPIAINNILLPGCLYFSDLKLLDIPKRHFNLNTSRTGDRWIKFCAELLRLSIQNLILNSCLSVAWRTEETTVLFFFKRIVTRYYLTLNNIEVGDGKEGFLERVIVARVKEAGEIRLKDLLRNTFDVLLGSNKSFVNPGKHLLAILIEKHPKEILTYQYDLSLLSGHIMTVYLHASPTARQLLDLLQTQINTELNHNNEFAQFDSALKREIERALFRKTDHS